MNQAAYDTIVVGAGSGGLGAALAAARLGLSVLLIEEADTLGGNAVRGGVHCWEAGVGGTGLPFEIYRQLKAIPRAVGIYSFGRHCCWPQSNLPPFPGGELLIDPAMRYRDTLRRYGARNLADGESFVRRHWHGVVFEPDAYLKVLEQLLRETGNCAVITGRSFCKVALTRGDLEAVVLDDGTRVTAGTWIDGTNTAALCRACGCAAAAPGPAPLNAVTLIYRVTPAEPPSIEALPADVPAKCWWAPSFPCISCAQYANGDRNCNMLPSMSGEEYLALGPVKAYAECRRRVLAHWHWVQSEYPEFRAYRLAWVAPALGVRETVHLQCDYQLTELDLTQGLSGQKHADLIALADHALDRHGEGGGCRELEQPYGIPWRCLLPKGLGNVLVASIAAGFNQAAATSCRLSRTMLQLGQAAGTAVALSRQRSVSLRELDPAELRKALRRQHVQLDWPMTEELACHLGDE